MTKKIELNSLSADERRALMEELAAEQKAAEERVKSERESYKKLVDDTVRESFQPLVALSQTIKAAKHLVFSNFETVLEMKAELFGVKDSQQSHTFTTEDGSISIKMGHRVVENFDDTLSAGIEKVKNYLATLAKDTESAALVETIMDLLKKDAKGNLKASRVLELEKLAGRVQNAEFSDGIRIIRESYRPLKSCQFIEVRFKDENGHENTLPLSISAFD
jgi:hypothetical protein